MGKKRILYIDLLKGLGIMAMVLCHVGTNGYVRHLIYGFHMPLFFFVSGLFYKRKEQTFLSMTLNKAKVLLVPYLFFCSVQYVCWLLFESESFSLFPFIQCFCVNTNSTMLFAKSCWFLTAMFFVQVLYDCVRRYIISETHINLCIMALGVGGVIGKNIIDLPLATWPACVGIVFYHIAYSLRKSKVYDKFYNMKLSFSVLLCILAAIIIMLNGDVDMKKSLYSNPILFLAGALGAIIGGMNIINSLCQAKCSEKNIVRVAIKTISYIGATSIVYLGLNELVIKYVLVIMKQGMLPRAVYRLLVWALTMLICAVFDYIIRKTKLRILIGK